jgi:Enoyl-CoA hydratase/isomerase
MLSERQGRSRNTACLSEVPSCADLVRAANIHSNDLRDNSRFQPKRSILPVACGLGNAVVPQAELRKKAHDAAITLTKRPAGALKSTKKLMRDHERIEAQISGESQLFKQRLMTPEAREAFAAFAERRPPDFSKVA